MNGEGVAVWMRNDGAFGTGQIDTRTYSDLWTNGRWFSEAHAAALLDVARLTDLFVLSPEDEPYRESLIEALDRLDAAKAGGEDA